MDRKDSKPKASPIAHLDVSTIKQDINHNCDKTPGFENCGTKTQMGAMLSKPAVKGN